MLSLFTFSCISYWQTGLGIVQCCNIVPSFVSSIGESWDSGHYFVPQTPRGLDHFYGAGRGVHPWFYALYATLLTTHSTMLSGCHYGIHEFVLYMVIRRKLNCSANSNQCLISKENFYDQQQQKSACSLLLKSQSQAWVINAALKSL